MMRHLWRAAGGSTLLVVCLMSLSSQSFGQGVGTGAGLGGAGILNDPFTFYYAIYLPNQQLQSLRTTPTDTINYGAMVRRQYYTQNDRRGLYDPISPYSDQNYDPLHPYSRQQGSERRARPFRFGRDPSNLDGTGPSLYYGRAAAYFPTLRAGRGRNANVYTRGWLSAYRQLYWPGVRGRWWHRGAGRRGRRRPGWRAGGRPGWNGWHAITLRRASCRHFFLNQI